MIGFFRNIIDKYLLICSWLKQLSMLYPALLSLFLLFLLFAGPAYSIQLGNTEVTPQLIIKGEYDDNINLSSGLDKDIKDDFVLHFTPTIQSLLPFKGHKFFLDLTADYRRGTKEKISELNTSLRGGADLVFPGGFILNFIDTYSRTKFDRTLFEESDVSHSQANTYEVTSSYTFLRRIKLNGGYRHRWEESENDSGTDERNIDTAGGGLSIPMTWHSSLYSSCEFDDEDFKETNDRDFSSNRYLLGVKWEGPYRFSLWVEGGQKEVDYVSLQEDDINGFFGNIGLGVRFSEITQGQFSFGRNVYGKYEYDGRLNYQHSEDTTVSFSASKTTNTSFSISSRSNTFEAARYSLKIEKNFIDKFSISLSGSYIIHTFDSDGLGEDKDKIIVVEGSVAYPIQKWLDVGMNYQYAQRSSNNALSEYKNNRVGMFLKSVF
ncbi:MAG: outer membrane beta-barrel protein [Nitrospirae bacterium]|nr:outer membrane beta-barrel protein [Nitrospirota bacterium]